MSLRYLLKRITSSQQRVYIKKIKRYILNVFQHNKAKTTLSELRYILTHELGLKAKDRIIVSSSFGNLHAAYSPEEVIKLLQSIVTEEGLIMMPYYPPMNSDEWAKGNHVFDMLTTKSGMGILTNVFSKMDDVYKSKHPTKAVCAWGKEAEEIIQGHEYATTPFYWDSPYGKLLKKGCKSLGLGLKNIPIFHAFEDVFSENKLAYYEPMEYNLVVRTQHGINEIVKTHIHNSHLLSKCMSAGDYVASLHCKTYKKIDFGYSYVYIIDNIELLDVMRKMFEKGNSRLKA